MQGSMTKLLVAGVQPTGGNTDLSGIRAEECSTRFSSRMLR
jgi:hypothetical protein